MLKISSLFEAYITNLGKYNEGRLVGETLKFPATTEEVQALLKRIGVDGVRYEEIFITSFDGDVLGLYDHLGEYESIDELNHLAHVLSDLDQSDIEKFEAVIDSGEYTGSVHDLINLAQNLDCYDFYPGIDSEEALGRAYIEEMEMLDVPDNVCCPTSTLKPTGGTCGSTRAAILPPAAMCSIMAVTLWSGITGWKIFPRSTASSPIPS